MRVISAEGKAGQSVKAVKDKFTAFKGEHVWAGLADDIDPGLLKLVDIIVDPPVSPTDTPFSKAKATADRLKNAYDLGMKVADLATAASAREALYDGIAGNVFDRILMAVPFIPALAALVELPAATSGAVFLGMFHTHQHPPSWVPPAPPVPLLSTGQIITGCGSVWIGGLPAATTGDIGYALGCGSLSPYFKIFTGSSSVKIGGKRAARIGDLVKYCQPSPPAKPGDPPVPKNRKEAFIATVKDKYIVKASKADDSRLAKWRNKTMTGRVAAFGAASTVLGWDKSQHDLQKARDVAKAKHDEAASKSDDPAAQAAAAAADAAVETQEATIAAQNEALAAGALTAGADLLRDSLDKLMGKDPGTPPPWGQIMIPASFKVVIGGIPMPESAFLAGKGRGMLKARGERKAKRAEHQRRLQRFEVAKSTIAARKGRKATTPQQKAADARAAVALMNKNDREQEYEEKVAARLKKSGKEELTDAEHLEIKTEMQAKEVATKEAMQQRTDAHQADLANAKNLIAQKRGVTPDKVSDQEAKDAVQIRKEAEDPELRPSIDRARAMRAAREAAEKEAKETATNRANEAVTKSPV